MTFIVPEGLNSCPLPLFDVEFVYWIGLQFRANDANVLNQIDFPIGTQGNVTLPHIHLNTVTTFVELFLDMLSKTFFCSRLKTNLGLFFFPALWLSFQCNLAEPLAYVLIIFVYISFLMKLAHPLSQMPLILSQ